MKLIIIIVGVLLITVGTFWAVVPEPAHLTFNARLENIQYIGTDARTVATYWDDGKVRLFSTFLEFNQLVIGHSYSVTIMSTPYEHWVVTNVEEH